MQRQRSHESFKHVAVFVVARLLNDCAVRFAAILISEPAKGVGLPGIVRAASRKPKGSSRPRLRRLRLKIPSLMDDLKFMSALQGTLPPPNKVRLCSY